MESEINYLFELLINPIIRDHILKYLKFSEILLLRCLSHSIKSFVDEIYLPGLKELKIKIFKYYSEVPRSTIPLCVSKHTGALRVLDVSYININVDFIQLIRSNPNIIELHVSNSFTPRFHIESPLKLKNLLIFKWTYVNISPLFWNLLSAPSIQEISLEGCDWVKDDILEALSHCTTLKYLNLQLCSEITDAGLGFLANGCPGLKTIFLKSNLLITDDGINLKILKDKGVITGDDYEVVDDNSWYYSSQSPEYGSDSSF